LLGGVVGGFIGLFIALTQTPLYQAKARAFPTVKTSSSGDGLFSSIGRISALNRDRFAEKGSLDNIILMKSSAFKWYLIQEQGLLHYFYNEKWDEALKQWVRPEPSTYNKIKSSIRSGLYELIGEKTSTERYSREDALVFFDRYFKLTENSQAGVAMVTVTLPNPERAAEWANAYFFHLNEYIRTIEMAKATDNLVHLQQELENTTQLEMRAILLNLLENEKKKEMVAVVNKNFAFTIMDPASKPMYRSSPKRGLILVLSFCLGVFAVSFYQIFISSFTAKFKKIRALANESNY